MSYRPDKEKLTDTQIHTHTHTGDDNTRRPKGPRVKMDITEFIFTISHVTLRGGWGWGWGGVGWGGGVGGGGGGGGGWGAGGLSVIKSKHIQERQYINVKLYTGQLFRIVLSILLQRSTGCDLVQQYTEKGPRYSDYFEVA